MELVNVDIMNNGLGHLSVANRQELLVVFSEYKLVTIKALIYLYS